MTPRQIDLVQESWIRVHGVRAAFSAGFYAALFAFRPRYRPPFQADLDEQGRKLMAMLNAVILNLKDLRPVEDHARELGRLHGTFGIGRADYEAVEGVLLSALATSLPEGLDDELAAAWRAAYWRVSELMLSATGA